MEKFFLEKASLKRKEEALAYLKEFEMHSSMVNGDSGLSKMATDYEEWLKYLDSLLDDEKRPSNRCPGIEYFLIRENDGKLIGMISLRWDLNDEMLLHGGHIGYDIRPSQRRKGYNKINLYLCLLKAKEMGLEKVLFSADDDNLGSVKTILSLGGVLENKINYDGSIIGRYWINVNNAILKNKNKYKDVIKKEWNNKNKKFK